MSDTSTLRPVAEQAVVIFAHVIGAILYLALLLHHPELMGGLTIGFFVGKLVGAFE